MALMPPAPTCGQGEGAKRENCFISQEIVCTHAQKQAEGAIKENQMRAAQLPCVDQHKILCATVHASARLPACSTCVRQLGAWLKKEDVVGQKRVQLLMARLAPVLRVHLLQGMQPDPVRGEGEGGGREAAYPRTYTTRTMQLALAEITRVCMGIWSTSSLVSRNSVAQEHRAAGREVNKGIPGY